MKSLRLIAFGVILAASISGCMHKGGLPLGEAKAMIENKSVNFFNAQSGTTNVGGMYVALTTVFGTSDGQGICITLVTRNKFEPKEYKVRFVERPDIENAQMTYNAADHKVYEAVSKIGSGSVVITKITNTYIKGTFSGKFILQGAANSMIEIKGGEFNANYTPTPPEF